MISVAGCSTDNSIEKLGRELKDANELLEVTRKKGTTPCSQCGVMVKFTDIVRSVNSVIKFNCSQYTPAQEPVS